MDLYDTISGARVAGLELPDYDALLGCIRCGRCLPVCPTYVATRLETFSPRGRLSLLRAVEDGKLEPSRSVSAHLYHCLDCRACNTVCPAGVAIGELIVDGRAACEPLHPRPWWLRLLLKAVLASPARTALVSLPIRAIQTLRLDHAGASVLGGLPGVGRTIRSMAQYAPRLQHPLHRVLPRLTRAEGPPRHRVAFFLGCLMNVAMPHVSRATVRVLARVGCDVITPSKLACCGAPHDDQGMRDTALRLARHNIALFEPLLDEVEAIVTDCAGCGAALKEYARWLRHDPRWFERARRFSARVKDITEWLDAVWPADLSPRLPPRIGTYHDPCHLANVQGVRSAPRALLARVEGLTLRPLSRSDPVECCGSAGIYNLTHDAMALTLLERKMALVEATNADLVASANPGCLMQLAWGLRRSRQNREVRHVVEVLDAGLTRAGARR
jgi:glycolate oxidase iron-sulfur subunit